MPSEEKLNEVLKQKQNEIAEAIETKRIYNKEIEELIRQTSIRRTELSTESKKQLKDYESNIPLLESKIKNLNKRIDELDVIIEEKNKKANAEQDNYKKHYENLESDLIKSYKSKEEKLEVLNNIYFENQELLKKQSEELEEAKKQLSDDNEQLVINQINLEKDKKAFLNKQGVYSKEVDSIKSKLADDQIKLDNQEKILEVERLENSQEKQRLIALDKQTTEVLSKVVEFEKIEETVEAKMLDNIRVREELSQLQVKIIADNRKIDIRLEELGMFERKLNEREKNIKLAEEKIAKG